jgi:hypothetical protein
MKKLLCLMILGLFLISMIGVVSAKTIVGGTIYDDNGIVVNEAEVTVSCEHTHGNNLGTYSITTDSLSDGSYAVEFYEGELGEKNCVTDDEVTVTAIKDEMSGSETGIVHDFGLTVNLAIINVTVPEFGLLIGVLTALSAVGIFAFVRR